MKTWVRNLLLLPVLIADFGLVLSGSVTAQTFTTLHSFTALNSRATNSDGISPFGGVVLSGNTLYGTAYIGGTSNAGTVFTLNTDGTGFTNLHSFAPSEGNQPYAGVVL